MSLTETLHRKQHDVEATRDGIQQLTEQLLRADDMLGKTDEALIGVQEVAERSRRAAPYIGLGIAAAAAITITVVVMRRRRASRR